MTLIVGSKNLVKIDAVRMARNGFAMLLNHKIVGVNVSSSVSDQPTSLEEAVRGAQNRARGAFETGREGDYGIGLESGCVDVPHVGLMDLTACMIYDGNRMYPGLSPAFSLPGDVTELVRSGRDLNQAFYELGLTDDPKLGSSEGIISILSDGRVTRRDYTIPAVEMALINLSFHNSN